MRFPRVRFAVRMMMAVQTFGLTLIFGCVDSFGPGSLDYSYDVSGSYQVFRSSSHQVRVVPKGPYESGTAVIPPEVVEIAWDESYILAKQQPLKRWAPDNGYEVPVPGRFNYWILDLRRRTAFGPLTREGFQAKGAELGISRRLELKSVEQHRPR